MNRRLSADAKIALERAGYRVCVKTRPLRLEFGYKGRLACGVIMITDDTVRDSEVAKWLWLVGCDEFGYAK